jgi:hypothetical protein
MKINKIVQTMEVLVLLLIVCIITIQPVSADTLEDSIVVQLDSGVNASIEKWTYPSGDEYGMARIYWEPWATDNVSSCKSFGYMSDVKDIAESDLGIEVTESVWMMGLELIVHARGWAFEEWVESILGKEYHDSNPADIGLTENSPDST